MSSFVLGWGSEPHRERANGQVFSERALRNCFSLLRAESQNARAAVYHLEPQQARKTAWKVLTESQTRRAWNR